MKIRVRGISYTFNRIQEDPDLPYIVMLHGFMGNGEALRSLTKELQRFCNPVTIDLLGHGETEGAELYYRFSAKEQVADLVKLIREQMKVPLFLYGYSMGARLALQLALHRSDLLQGLILESGTFGIERETERQARQSLDASRADQITGNFKGFLEEWRNMPMFTSGSSSEYAEELERIQATQDPTWMANSLLGFGSGTMPCVREQLKSLPTPTLLAVGGSDSKFIRINQNMHKEIRDSHLEIFENAGHRVHIDQPGVLAARIRKFIQNHTLS